MATTELKNLLSAVEDLLQFGYSTGDAFVSSNHRAAQVKEKLYDLKRKLETEKS